MSSRQSTHASVSDTVTSQGGDAANAVSASARTCNVHKYHPAHGRKYPVGGTVVRPLIVLGATGAVGRGIVQATVEAAVPVIAVARDAQALARLREQHAGADISTLVCAVAGDADGARLADALRALRRPAIGVVAAMAAARQRGRLLDHPVVALRDELENDLLPQLSAARHLLPLLAEGHGGSYVLIGGPGGESPWAGYGHRSVAAAAQRMLACVLHDEARALDVRVHLLAVDMPARTEINRMHACSRWPCALEIGQQALALVQRGDSVGINRAVVPFATQARGTSGVPPPCAQEAERFSGDVAQSCLDDARRLLGSLSPARNRNEVSQ